MTELTRRDLLRGGLALSVVTLVSDAAMAHANALLSGYPALLQRKPLRHWPRERLLFDFGWKFCLGSDSDPLRDLDFGKDQSSYQGGFAKTGGFDLPWRNSTTRSGARSICHMTGRSSFLSSTMRRCWLTVISPRSEVSRDLSGLVSPDLRYSCFRRRPSHPPGIRRRVQKCAGLPERMLHRRNDNGYAPFHFDITDFLNYGEKNFLVVRLDVSYGDGWYYEGAGIYRHVWLTKTDALHLGKWESYVRSDVKGKIATLTLGTVVLNEGGRSERLSVHWQILDADGNTVAEAESSQSDPSHRETPPRSPATTVSCALQSIGRPKRPTSTPLSSPSRRTASCAMPSASALACARLPSMQTRGSSSMASPSRSKAPAIIRTTLELAPRCPTVCSGTASPFYVKWLQRRPHVA